MKKLARTLYFLSVVSTREPFEDISKITNRSSFVSRPLERRLKLIAFDI